MTVPAFGHQQHPPTQLTPSEVEPTQMVDEVEPQPLDVSQGMIRIDVTVQDSSGSPVGGLAQQDVTLLDNGQPVKIVSFDALGATAAPDPPIEVILMIDELNMPEKQLPAEEFEAENFLRRNLGHLHQPVTVYWIDEDGLSTSGSPSYDGNVLADEISQRRLPKQIWKAPPVPENLEKLAKDEFVWKKPSDSLVALGSIAIEQRRRPGRKLMFWLGYGWKFLKPEATGASGQGTTAFDFLTEISTRLREARISLWGANEWHALDRDGNQIPVSTPVIKVYPEDVTLDKVNLGFLQLDVIATETGGGLLVTDSDLADLIAKHVEQANCFYSLTFDPSRTNVVDDYHRLQVEVGDPALAAHTRAGYFDQPVFYDQSRDDLERLTVAELEQLLGADHTKSGTDQAALLSKTELTERLSSIELIKLESMLKDKKAREALIGLADQSAFLAPPAQDIPSTPAPDEATQHLMISRTREYVSEMIPKLPDFFASRTISQYQERPTKSSQSWKTTTGGRSFYLSEVSDAIVLFRSGKEVVQGEKTKSSHPKGEEHVLSTVGTFGAVMNTVLVGATSAGSDLQWSHWETGPTGEQAVFRYRAPYPSPVFVVSFTYLGADTSVPIRSEARFQGEFSVDPKTGAILRLTIQADLPPRLPLERSDVMVEYGPEVIGGQTYICPIRSVSIQRQRKIVDIQEWGEEFKVYAPLETLLNDMAYSKYHKFHSTSQILPGYTPVPKDY
jgi:VWFA-related protein